jgi:flagellar biosynthesis protein FlhB
VLAKGAGFLAARMRDVARMKSVPMMRVPPLARELYRECDLDHPIPEHTYRDIAGIYRSLAERASKGSLA